MGKPVTLYRYFDRHDVLLYVGITRQGIRRSFQHYGTARWWRQVSRATFVQYATLDRALAAEKQAIWLERPKYNIDGRHGPQPQARILVFFAAYAQGRTHLTDAQLCAVLGVSRAGLNQYQRDGLFQPEPGPRRRYAVEKLCPELRLLAGLRRTRPFGQPCMDPNNLDIAQEQGLVAMFGKRAQNG